MKKNDARKRNKGRKKQTIDINGNELKKEIKKYFKTLESCSQFIFLSREQLGKNLKNNCMSEDNLIKICQKIDIAPEYFYKASCGKIYVFTRDKVEYTAPPFSYSEQLKKYKKTSVMYQESIKQLMQALGFNDCMINYVLEDDIEFKILIENMNKLINLHIKGLDLFDNYTDKNRVRLTYIKKVQDRIKPSKKSPF